MEADFLRMSFFRSPALAALMVASTIFVGCQSDAGNGALIGGGVGALAGGIIGHQSGHAVGGALIGGAVGAGTGALIGHASDEHKKDKREAYDRGYDDAQRSNASSYRSQPTAGYTQYSETTRTSAGTGGYHRSSERSYSSGEYYAR